MEHYMNMRPPTYSSLGFGSRMEQMYPDAHTRIFPHVQYLVDSLGDDELHSLTGDDVDRITHEAMRRSGVLHDPPVGHNNDTLNDMTRSMVVRGFHDRFRRGRFFPFFSPFFFSPYDGRDRDRYYNYYRDYDYDRDRYL